MCALRLKAAHARKYMACSLKHCIQDTLSSRAALGLPAARAKLSCIQLQALNYAVNVQMYGNNSIFDYNESNFDGQIKILKLPNLNPTLNPNLNPNFIQNLNPNFNPYPHPNQPSPSEQFNLLPSMRLIYHLSKNKGHTMMMVTSAAPSSVARKKIFYNVYQSRPFYTRYPIVVRALGLVAA